MQDRRAFIKKTGALTVLSLASSAGLKAGVLPETSFSPQLILPARLKKGDTIGLITPGSPIKREQLDDAIVKLEGMGFRTTHDDSVLAEYGYFAGRDRQRADELLKMFGRKDVDGIWCLRGGYGCIRILDLLDYGVIQNNPKAFIGYSDITALHTAIYKETALVTFHGPLGISDFNKFSVKSFQKVLMKPGLPYKYPYSRDKETRKNPEFDRYTIRDGVAEGRLSGGNLSVLDSMIGSRFEPDFKNKIVYLEEIGEKTYRVDKMLFHLLSSTNLKEAAGIVLGVFSECNINDEPRLTLRVALDDLLKPLGIPVSYGLSFGHIDRIVTLPNGIMARMDAGRNSLTLLEEAVL